MIIIELSPSPSSIPLIPAHICFSLNRYFHFSHNYLCLYVNIVFLTVLLQSDDNQVIMCCLSFSVHTLSVRILKKHTSEQGVDETFNRQDFKEHANHVCL